MEPFFGLEAWWDALIAFMLVVVVLLGQKLLADPSKRGRVFRRALAIMLAIYLFLSAFSLVSILRGARETTNLPAALVAISMCGLAWFLFVVYSRGWLGTRGEG